MTKTASPLLSPTPAAFAGRAARALTLLVLVFLAPALSATTLKVRIIATSDIHSHLTNYDYYQDTATEEYGFNKTASLIAREREGESNTLLIDNGDLIQGSPIVDAYRAARSTQKKGHTVHPAIMALNTMQVDVANIGNHELNFDMEELNSILADAKYPVVDGNLFTKEGKHAFKPYVILSRRFTTDSGFVKTIHIGVLGLLPPQVMLWDRANLFGKYVAKDMVQVAAELIPEMRAKGADIVILAAHTGIGNVSDPAPAENAGWLLAQLGGVDAIIGGHTHTEFPVPEGAVVPPLPPGVNPRTGMIGKVPMVIPGAYGDHVGVIDLTLESSQNTWHVATAAARLFGLHSGQSTALPAPDVQLVNQLKAVHEATLDYLKTPLGTLKTPLNSFFAVLRDDPSLDLVANAMLWRARRELPAVGAPSNLPLLAAVSPQRAGGGRADDYVDIPAGPLTRRAVAGLYIFPNTLHVVKVSGNMLREWLEMSAGIYRELKPAAGAQPLIDPAFPPYNFDSIKGVSYRIDLGQKPRYDKNGTLVSPASHRIVELSYNGHEVGPDDAFLVATNNYRAGGGGHFPGLDGSNIVMALTDHIPTILASFITEQQTITPHSDSHWALMPFTAPGPVTFTTSVKSVPLAEHLPWLQKATAAAPGLVTYELRTSAF